MLDLTKEEKVAIFKESDFLRGVSDETLSDLAVISEEIHYPKGSFISRNGALCQYVFIVSCGLLRVSACSDSGKRITFLLVKKGEPYNILSPFMVYPRFLEAEAAKDTKCLRIKSACYLEFIETHPEITPYIVGWIGLGLDSAISRILDLMEKKVEVRIMRVIRTLSAKFGSPLFFTSVEIAELAGTTPESTLRAMAILRDMGAIETQRGKIWVKNAEALKEFGVENMRF